MHPTSRHAPAPVGLAPGTPCWLELTTSAPTAAMEFYHAVLGWDYAQRVDGDGRPYYVATVDDEPVAGIRPVEWVAAEWVVFLATTNVADLVRVSAELGGRTVEEAHVVPRVGTKAVIQAPVGALFGACEIAPDWSFAAGLPTSLVWAEFITHFAPQADRYFGELFGYSGRQFGDGRDDDYMVWYVGDDSVIGRVRMMPGTPRDVPARWVAHFRIPLGQDFEQAVVNAHNAGARLRFRPYTSQLGRVAVMSDLTGGRFALIDPTLASNGAIRADDPFDD